MACCWIFQAVSKLKPKAKAEISAPSGPLKEMVDLEACSLRVLQDPPWVRSEERNALFDVNAKSTVCQLGVLVL